MVKNNLLFSFFSSSSVFSLFSFIYPSSSSSIGLLKQVIVIFNYENMDVKKVLNNILQDIVRIPSIAVRKILRPVELPLIPQIQNLLNNLQFFQI
jgi:hypothetical protein